MIRPIFELLCIASVAGFFWTIDEVYCSRVGGKGDFRLRNSLKSSRSLGLGRIRLDSIIVPTPNGSHVSLAFTSSIPGEPHLTSTAYSRRIRGKSPLGGISKSKAPDLSSALLSERTIFVGTPIQTTVAHLVIAQLLYLDHTSQKPIKIYINCGDNAVNEDPRTSCEIDALNIVDVMSYVKSDVITLNLGKAYGPASLILAAGTPGKRFVLPRAFTALRQSSASLETMPAEDIRIYSKEILKARKQVAAAFSRFSGKSEAEVLEALQRGRYMDAQEAIAYGLADKVVEGSETP
ncbi:ATP-dependent Clp protease proteolytic subunit [Babesia caballi]|uniref:ATP-dependent Clp protease proteolytic subunit n=1 Tax=Babesia caballi TaxID=5871 RepID=A0AAV4M181_BABCB|nr:ATP-dependent Clp protease proteolytic subunit [Babesia caballi]